MGRVLLLIVVAVLLYLLVRAVIKAVRAHRRRKQPWEAHARTKQDGSVLVQVEKPGQHARVIKELPAGASDAIDFSSDLALAMEDAELEASAMNRRKGKRW